MSQELNLKSITQRESYSFWTEDTVRFADLDPLNHLNNIATAIYCEAGRADLFVRELNHDFSDDINWVLANINISYLSPIHYPNDISIGTRVKKIGKSSLTLEQGLFSKDGCFSTAETILVWADLKKGSGLAISDEMKEIFKKFF